MSVLVLLAVLAAPASAECVYKLEYSVEWEADEKAWLGYCEKAGNDEAQALAQAKQAFWEKCVERLSAGVPKGKARTREISEACSYGASVARSFASRRLIEKDKEPDAASAAAYARGASAPESASFGADVDALVELLKAHAEPEDLSIAWEALAAKPELRLEPAGNSVHERGRFEVKGGAPRITLSTRASGKPVSQVALAGTLLHELHHLARWKRGGGANVYTLERDARDAQFRFYTRYEEAKGELPLDPSRKALLELWKKKPGLAKADVSECYAPAPGVDGTIEGEKAATSDPRRLAALEADEREANAAAAFQAEWRKRMKLD